MLGLAPLASAPLLGTTWYPAADEAAAEGPDISVYIAGAKTELWNESSLSIDEDLNSRGTCEFTLCDVDGEFHANIGENVRVLYKGVCIFAGTVDQITETVPLASRILYSEIRCVDYSQIFDRHMVNTWYAPGQTVYQIVADVVNVQSGLIGETIADESITFTTATVDQGPLLEKMVFRYMKASEVLDKLCEMVGFSWWVDTNKVLHVKEATSYLAPVNFDTALWGEFRDLEYEESRANYRNVQYFEGGQTTTAEVAAYPAAIAASTRWQKFKGDGENKTFTCALELAAKPRIFIDTSGGGYVEVNPSLIATKEQDEDAEWFWEQGNADVSQNTDAAFTALSSAKTLQIYYQGYFPIVTVARSQSEIDTRADVEGGAGVYADIESEEDMDSQDLAVEYAAALLRKYGRMECKLSFNTFVHGFHAGQYLRVVCPEHRQTGDALVESVSLVYACNLVDAPLEYKVNLVMGESQGGWAAFFKRWATAGRPFKFSENDSLNYVLQYQEKIKLSDTLKVDIGDVRPLWTIDPYTHWIYGYSAIGRTRDDGSVSGPQMSLPPRIAP